MSILTSLLEIAIVLAAIYVSLSCVCSAINEQIASLLQRRGAMLYQGILNLLVGNRALVDAIFVHPIIAASSDDKNGVVKADKSYRPSYIDARNFSMALWQSVRAQQALPADAVAATLVKSPTLMLDDLALRVQALPASELQHSLGALIAAADGNYGRLLAATDGWFNAQMDRVSGWYKRQAQANIAIIAAIVVLISGIDSIEIGSTLYFDQKLRTSVVDAIAGAMPAQPAQPATAGAGQPKGGGAAGSSAVQREVDRQLQGQLGQFFHSPLDWLQHLRHFPGMVVTFLALLLGGPFWFDALCSLVNVRLAGRKPQRDDQPPK